MVAPPPIELGSLGMADSLILMVLALVVFGPRRLPQIGRQIGKLMYEFRKASNDFKFQMEEELRLAEDADRRKKEEAERARNLALNPPAPGVEAQAAIGADDQASVSAPAGLYSGSLAAEAATEATPEAATEATPEAATEATPEAATEATPEAAVAPEESHIRYPRINPPSSGEPVPTARPGAAAVAAEPEAESGVTAEANAGSEPPAISPEAGPDSDAASESGRTEPVSQHG